jgi:hypothetical protein
MLGRPAIARDRRAPGVQGAIHVRPRLYMPRGEPGARPRG